MHLQEKSAKPTQQGIGNNNKLNYGKASQKNGSHLKETWILYLGQQNACIFLLLLLPVIQEPGVTNAYFFKQVCKIQACLRGSFSLLVDKLFLMPCFHLSN